MVLLLLLLRLAALAGDAAVIVGLSDDPRFEEVGGFEARVEAWRQWLVTEADVDPERVSVLRDEEASREAALDAANQLVLQGGRVWWIHLGESEGS